MFRISFVCTGNRCRSAVAAAAVASLTEGLPVSVDSCGTLDMEGECSPRESLVAARKYGLSLDAHRSRFLGSAGLDTSNLVIGFERHHCAAAVVEGGASAEKTFTLREITRLLDEIGPATDATGEQRARDLVAAAHLFRSKGRSFVPGEEIADPIGRPLQVHLDITGEVIRLCERLCRSLFSGKERLRAL